MSKADEGKQLREACAEGELLLRASVRVYTNASLLSRSHARAGLSTAMPPTPPWARASVSSSRTTMTTTVTTISTSSSTRRRASTGNKSYREPSNFSDDEDGLSGSATPTPTLATPGLKEAREQCQNNLRLAWESIFTRYSQGQHLAAGRDDVFDFGTGEVVEDAGFLDDFIVEDDDVVFEGRSIEIGDFGLPGASGMNDLTDSSGEEEETPVISRRSSLKSESDSDLDEGSEDDLQLARYPSNARSQASSFRSSKLDRSRRGISRSVSMPESVDLLSSSDDEMGQRDVHPVSDKYKEIKRVRTSMKEDLREFQEAENARQAKEEADRVKRERTCTPFFGSANVAHLVRAQSIRPIPRSAPSSSSYRPHIPSYLGREASITPSKPRRYPTPVPSSSSSFTSVKPESSSSSIDIKPFRASSSRPQGRCFSLKPSSSSSSSGPISSTSAIPLGHYSNTLLNQAVACEDDSSDDELAIRSPSIRSVQQDERDTFYSAYSGKGKERAKEGDEQRDDVFSNDRRYTHHQIPSLPPSRTQQRRKRSPTFFSSPTSSSLPPLYRQQSVRPVVEIVRSASRPPPVPRLVQTIPKHSQSHSVPRMPTSRLEQYRPKQSSPLKRSSQQLHRPSASMPGVVATKVIIDVSSDEDDDIPLRTVIAEPRAPIVNNPSRRSVYKQQRTPRQAYTSPTKRKYSDSPESPESPLQRARMVLPTPPRSFSSASSSLSPNSKSPITPSVPLAKMSLSSSKSAPALSTRRFKEETPDAFPVMARKIKREESILPPSQYPARNMYSSHLPTPPISSGSATAFAACKEETPDIKPEEKEETFKAPSPRKKKITRMPSIAPGRRSTPATNTSIPTTSQQKGKGRVKQESERFGNVSDDDDDILLVSPARSSTSLRKKISASSLLEGSPVRHHSGVKHEHTSPRRAQSVARPSPKASPTITRDRPPPSNDGYESDDPMAI